MTSETNIVNQSSFKGVIQRYFEYLLKQYAYFPTVVNMLEKSGAKEYKAYEKFIKDKQLRAKVPKDATISDNALRVPFIFLPDLKDKEEKAMAFDFIVSRLFETQFVDCVSSFDVFLAGIFRTILAFQPDILNSSDKTITYKELQEISNIEMARKMIVQDFIDNAFRGSHIEQMREMKKRFRLDIIGDCPQLFSKFVELTERRNVLIHCNGIASSQYYSICKQNDVTNIAPEGTRLSVSMDYFRDSTLTLLEFSLIIGYISWKKFSPDDNADEYLINSCDNLCCEGLYQVVISLVDFALNTCKRKPNNLNKHHLKLYQIYALKKMGKNDDAKRIISGEDWTSVDDSIKLLLHVLKDDISNAICIMKRNGDNRDHAKRYASLDIYSDLIIRKEFLSAYEEIFGEPFLYRREEYIKNN